MAKTTMAKREGDKRARARAKREAKVASEQAAKTVAEVEDPYWEELFQDPLVGDLQPELPVCDTSYCDAVFESELASYESELASYEELVKTAVLPMELLGAVRRDRVETPHEVSIPDVQLAKLPGRSHISETQFLEPSQLTLPPAGGEENHLTATRKRRARRNRKAAKKTPNGRNVVLGASSMKETVGREAGNTASPGAGGDPGRLEAVGGGPPDVVALREVAAEIVVMDDAGVGDVGKEADGGVVALHDVGAQSVVVDSVAAEDVRKEAEGGLVALGDVAAEIVVVDDVVVEDVRKDADREVGAADAGEAVVAGGVGKEAEGEVVAPRSVGAMVGASSASPEERDAPSPELPRAAALGNETWADEEVARPSLAARLIDCGRSAGVHDQAAYRPVADFLGVLPDIKRLGTSLRTGRSSSLLARLVSEDKIGGAEGNSLRTLVQGLAIAARASPSQGASGSNVRDMRMFYETVRSFAYSVGTHDDAGANRRHLQKLGLALLDMAMPACRLIDRLVSTFENPEAQRAMG